MKRFIRFVIIAAIALSALGTSAGGAIYLLGWDKIYHCRDKLERLVGSDKPIAIAKRFWVATLNGRKETAYWYMQPMEGLVPEMAGAHRDDEVILGDVVQQDGYQMIDTTLILNRENGQRYIRLKTVMVPNENGDWMVDFWSSQQTTFDVVIEDSAQRLGILLSSASSEFPHLLNVGGEAPEESKAAAEKQIDEALKSAKERIMSAYAKHLHQSKPSEQSQNNSTENEGDKLNN